MIINVDHGTREIVFRLGSLAFRGTVDTCMQMAVIEFVALLSPRSGHETHAHRGHPWAYFAASEDYISGSKNICTLMIFTG